MKEGNSFPGEKEEENVMNGNTLFLKEISEFESRPLFVIDFVSMEPSPKGHNIDFRPEIDGTTLAVYLRFRIESYSNPQILVTSSEHIAGVRQ